jgi:hypothetical protein
MGHEEAMGTPESPYILLAPLGLRCLRQTLCAFASLRLIPSSKKEKSASVAGGAQLLTARGLHKPGRARSSLPAFLIKKEQRRYVYASTGGQAQTGLRSP